MDVTSDDFSHLRDVLGNLLFLKRYTLQSLFFHLDTSASIKDVEMNLRRGLEQLSKGVPWLAGHVVYKGKIRQIVPLEDCIRLVVKDVRHRSEIPDMQDFHKAKYPFSMLDPELIISQDVLPENYSAMSPYQETPERPARVLVVQATFLRGGVILTFHSNHTTMDMTGLGQIVCLFAKACRNESFSQEEIVQANQDRRTVMPLLGDDYKPGPESNYFMYKPRNRSSGPTSPPVWQYFNITAKNLSKLKEKASNQKIVPYISTNDAVCAFIWQHITKVRTQRLGTNIETELNRQMNARKILGLSDGYLGHMTTSVHSQGVDVYDKSLGEIAGKLRQNLRDTEYIKFELRAMATVLDRVEETMGIGYDARLDENRDVIVSSHAEVKVCQVSFGPLLGVAVAARRPRVTPIPCLVFLMPTDANGDMAAAVCLREDDMQRLREDEEFTSFAEHIG